MGPRTVAGGLMWEAERGPKGTKYVSGRARTGGGKLQHASERVVETDGRVCHRGNHGTEGLCRPTRGGHRAGVCLLTQGFFREDVPFAWSPQPGDKLQRKHRADLNYKPTTGSSLNINQTPTAPLMQTKHQLGPKYKHQYQKHQTLATSSITRDSTHLHQHTTGREHVTS